MNKILITGSNGIIGRQLLAQLLDSYPSAEFTVINRNRMQSPVDIRVNVVELDLLNIDEARAEDLFNKIKPDLFFHLAWDTAHKDYLTTQDNKVWENISVILINSFYASGGKKFIGIGSSIEYDWKEQSPFNESVTALNGNGWLYGQCKLNVYNYLASLPDIDYLWCRIFFVFGPGQGRTRLVPLIINNALNGGSPLSINVRLERDYISTFEIARQIIMMQQTKYSGAVNICSGRVVKLGDMIHAVENYTSKQVELSNAQYQDNFENESIGGSIELIERHYPNYSYTYKNFEMDLGKAINSMETNNS
jgi:nucleoside-diphosphate-sugar epimerase